MRSFPVLGLVLVLASCEEPAPPEPHPVRFLAVADPGEPLAGVSISAGGVTSVTDASGTIAMELAGVEGASVPITAACPEGHRLAASPPPLVLRRVIDLATGSAAVLQVTIACPPVARHGVIVVRAGGTGAREGIPVLLDGTVVATTDRSGVAHVALERAPGSTFEVQLATSTVMPLLRPADPTMPFTFSDADEIFVFDRPFESEEPPRTPPRGPRGPRPPPPPTPPVHGPPVNLGAGR